MSLVLLSSEGVVAKRLSLVSPPPDYVVPNGMMLSWKEDVTFIHTFANWREDWLPSLAYFYLKTAQGEVRITSSYGKEQSFSVVVQARNPADLIALRDKILEFFHRKVRWGVYNNFNSFWSELARRF